jgi:acyl carrier protein
VGQGPLDRQQVFELIRDCLADILELDPGSIPESASFSEDLGADSLAMIELVEAVEAELGEHNIGLVFEDEALVGLKTVRDAVDHVVGHLSRPSRGGDG